MLSGAPLVRRLAGGGAAAHQHVVGKQHPAGPQQVDDLVEVRADSALGRR